MTDTVSCPVCSASNVESLAPPCTYIRHMDFRPMHHQPQGLRRCRDCGCVFMADRKTIDEMRDIYAGTDYAREKKTEHRVHESGAENARMTTYRAIADFLSGAFRTEAPRILDVGCFDGKLLLELEKDCTNAEMHGFDVSHAISQRFPKLANYRYWCPDLEEIDGTFDLICIVNTLMYIEKPHAFMNQMERLLAPDGLLFIITPNTAINPCFLTLGDQMLYFSPENLAGMLSRYGFATEVTSDHTAFPRSILACCRRSGAAAGRTAAGDRSFAEAVDWLSRNAGVVREAVATARNDGAVGRVCLLGGAHNAAWAFNAAGGDIDCFIDENPARVGTAFYGKPVIHPRETNPADTILLPYGKTAKAIAEKFAKLYAASLVQI